MLLQQTLDGVEHRLPGLVLRLSVVDVRDCVSVTVGKRNLSNVLATLTVLLVGESGMVHVQVGLVLGHQVVAVVQVGGVLGEPRGLDVHIVLGHQAEAAEGVGLTEGTDQLDQVSARHIDLGQDIELDALVTGWTGLQVDNGSVIGLDGLQDTAQGAHAFAQTDDQGSPLHGVLSLRRLGGRIGQHNFLLGQVGICVGGNE